MYALTIYIQENVYARLLHEIFICTCIFKNIPTPTWHSCTIEYQ